MLIVILDYKSLINCNFLNLFSCSQFAALSFKLTVIAHGEKAISFPSYCCNERLLHLPN